MTSLEGQAGGTMPTSHSSISFQMRPHYPDRCITKKKRNIKKAAAIRLNKQKNGIQDLLISPAIEGTHISRPQHMNRPLTEETRTSS